jgi:hypothetical protein
MALQFRDELLGVQRGFRTHPGIEHAVDDQQAGLLPGDFLAQQPHHGVQPFLLRVSKALTNWI